MPKPISIIPTLALAAIALLIGGCGGGGDDAPTKAEFLKQAELICKKADSVEAQRQGAYFQKNFARIEKEPPPPNNTKTVADVVKQIRVPIILKELEELEALGYPEGDEEKLQEIIDGTKEGAEKLGEEPQLLWASRSGNPLYPSFNSARAYGFTVCAEA